MTDTLVPVQGVVWYDIMPEGYVNLTLMFYPLDEHGKTGQAMPVEGILTADALTNVMRLHGLEVYSAHEAHSHLNIMLAGDQVELATTAGQAAKYWTDMLCPPLGMSVSWGVAPGQS